MHYQNPPLIHRDLKVENILLSPPQTYKLCDFGSTTKPLAREKVPTTVEGIQKIEHEINKTTTLQYRAPELVDVWGRKGYDEKIGESPHVARQSRYDSEGADGIFCPPRNRHLGARRVPVQAVLLHDAFRGARATRHSQCSV